MNSGEVLVKDNPDPNSMNGIKVIEKEQRLTSEQPSNKLDTSAGQPSNSTIANIVLENFWLMI